MLLLGLGATEDASFRREEVLEPVTNQVTTAPGNVLTVAPNGNLVVVSNGADVFLYTGSTVFTLQNGPSHVTNATAAAFSPDSSRLMIVTRAPATRAPAGSDTTPLMMPVGVCARAEPAATNRTTKSFARILLTVICCA